MKVTLTLAALVLALSGLGLWQFRQGVVQKQRFETEKQALVAAVHGAAKARSDAEATLGHLRQKNAATARESALLRRSLDAALAAKPDWALEPTPKEVQDALQAP